MHVRLSTKVLSKGEVIAHSTTNIVDLEVPGTHTLDLVDPNEDPDITITKYQLVISVEEEPQPAPVVTPDPVPSRLSLK